MRVLSKGMVSFDLKLKALWIYIKTKKNISIASVLELHFERKERK